MSKNDSQKEKYNRLMQTQSGGSVNDVDALEMRVRSLEVDIRWLNHREAVRAADARKSTRDERRGVARKHRHELCIAAFLGLVSLLLIVRGCTAPRAAADDGATRTSPSWYGVKMLASVHGAPAVTGEVVDEAAQMEAALVAQGYFREDVPLSYSEQDFLQTACEAFGVPYALALAVVEQESRFTNVSNEDNTCIGYMQVMPKWHQARMSALGVENLMEPFENFRVGCAYLGELLTQYELGDALSVYKDGKPGSSDYSGAVLERMEKWEVALGEN